MLGGSLSSKGRFGAPGGRVFGNIDEVTSCSQRGKLRSKSGTEERWQVEMIGRIKSQANRPPKWAGSQELRPGKTPRVVAPGREKKNRSKKEGRP